MEVFNLCVIFWYQVLQFILFLFKVCLLPLIFCINHLVYFFMLKVLVTTSTSCIKSPSKMSSRWSSLFINMSFISYNAMLKPCNKFIKTIICNGLKKEYTIKRRKIQQFFTTFTRKLEAKQPEL